MPPSSRHDGPNASGDLLAQKEEVQAGMQEREAPKHVCVGRGRCVKIECVRTGEKSPSVIHREAREDECVSEESWKGLFVFCFVVKVSLYTVKATALESLYLQRCSSMTFAMLECCCSVVNTIFPAHIFLSVP